MPRGRCRARPTRPQDQRRPPTGLGWTSARCRRSFEAAAVASGWRRNRRATWCSRSTCRGARPVTQRSARGSVIRCDAGCTRVDDRVEPRRVDDSIPVLLDAVATRLIAVHRRDESEQTAVAAVSEQVATDFDEVADANIFGLDAVVQDGLSSRRFQSPQRRFAFLVLDLDIDPRVRINVMDLL